MARKTIAVSALSKYRSRPKAVLVEVGEELMLTFMGRLGYLMYDKDWNAIILKILNPVGVPDPVGSDAHMASTVRDQVIMGLRTGCLTACVYLTIAALPEAQRTFYPIG